MPDEAAPATVPADRRLDCPFLRFEGLQDDYETISNNGARLVTTAPLSRIGSGHRYALLVKHADSSPAPG